MGLLEMMYQRVVEGRDAKRNANLQALNQLRQLYPDQEINDQAILKGVEQEQQRINPNFRMPREERKSPFQTQLAPGEASPLSQSMVNQYIGDAPIRPVKAAKPGKEIWAWGPNGPVSTGKVLPDNSALTENPYLKDLRQQSHEIDKEERGFGRQLDLEDYRFNNQADMAVYNTRARNASKEIKTHLWVNPKTGQNQYLTEKQVNSGEYKGWVPYDPRQKRSFLDDEEDGNTTGQSSKPQLSRDAARAELKRLGIQIPE